MEGVGRTLHRLLEDKELESDDDDTTPLCPPTPPARENIQSYPAYLRTNADSREISSISSPPDFDKHCHTWWPAIDFSEDAIAIRQLSFVSVICFLFMVAQLIGGALANSLSIMTDAAHLSSDLASFLISILALYLKRKRPTTRFTYGYHRVETLGALISILVIWMLSAILCIMAVERIHRHQYDIDANDMLIVASLSVVFNIVMGIVLSSDLIGTAQKHMSHGHSHGGNANSSLEASPQRGHAHSHGDNHGHSHSYSSKNINIRAAFIHVIGDLVQSVGVLIAAVLIKINADWKIADPICTFVFSVIVLCTTLPVLRDILFILLEASPLDVDYHLLAKELMRIRGVVNVHNLHIWNLSTSTKAAIVHICVNNDSVVDRTELTKAATRIFVDLADIRLSTIQIEDSIIEYDLIPPLESSALSFVEHSTSAYMSCDRCRRFTPK